MKEINVEGLNAAFNIDAPKYILVEDDLTEYTGKITGFSHTEETKLKLSKIVSERMSDYKERQKISNTLKGRTFTKERKKNISRGLYKQKFEKYAKLYEFEWRGQIIKEFNTIKQLSRKYDIPKTTLLRKLGRTNK